MKNTNNNLFLFRDMLLSGGAPLSGAIQSPTAEPMPFIDTTPKEAALDATANDTKLPTFGVLKNVFRVSFAKIFLIKKFHKKNLFPRSQSNQNPQMSSHKSTQ